MKKLSLYLPDTRVSERRWISEIVLIRFLGLDIDFRLSERNECSLSWRGRTLHLSDSFFQQSSNHWLQPDSIPKLPLRQWDVADSGLDAMLVRPGLPVLFGEPDFQMSDTDTGYLDLDILGTAFFMLSRYEEAVLPDRDNHDRFPAAASLAVQAGFLDRPIIDEYVEVLWAAMRRVWPDLKRKPREPRTIVSCDVDRPFTYRADFLSLGERFAGDLIKRRSPAVAVRNAVASLQARKGSAVDDPCRAAIDWIMDVNDDAGNRVSFFFIPQDTHRRLDNIEDLALPRIRQLLREIHRRGHEIGFHPGYNTYLHPEAMKTSIQKLRMALEDEGVKQDRLGGRQHFLRWQTPTTARLWESNGLDYDSTLSFADQPGFRCGTCREYPLYDLTERRPLCLLERPLIVMECSVIAERYMGLGYSDESIDLMLRYRDTCHRFGGDFTLLWHNSHFTHPKDREFYLALIR